jgi:hypothetical protein
MSERLHPRMVALGIANHEPIAEDLVDQYIEAFQKVCAQTDVLQRRPVVVK